MVNWINLVFASLNNIFTVLFIFGMAFAIFGNNGFDLLNDVFGLIDSLFEAGFLGLDFDADFNVIFRLLNFVFYIKYDSSPFFLFSLFCLDGEDKTYY